MSPPSEPSQCNFRRHAACTHSRAAVAARSARGTAWGSSEGNRTAARRSERDGGWQDERRTHSETRFLMNSISNSEKNKSRENNYFRI